MSRRQHRALGEQGLRLVEETAAKLRDVEKAAKAARQAVRRKVESASQRPVPGSSDLLAGPVGGELRGVGGLGNPKTVTVHDLTSGGGTGGLAPIHLRRGG